MTKYPSEHKEQAGFVRWFKETYPGVLIYAIPNGGKRAIKTAINLKAEGVEAGIPDLHIPEWRLWIEMKRQKGGVLSPRQREIAARLLGIGHTVIVGHGARDASIQINEFLARHSPVK